MGAARAHGSAPGGLPHQTPPQAAADEPAEEEGDPRRRRGEDKHCHHGDQSDGHGDGDEEPGTEQGRTGSRVGPPTRASQEDAAVARKIGEQLRKVAVGTGAQRSLYPLLKLLRHQPALAGRLAQSVDDRVSIGIRRPQRVVPTHRSPER